MCVCVCFNGPVTNEQRLALQIDARLRFPVDYNTVVWWWVLRCPHRVYDVERRWMETRRLGSVDVI